MTLDERQLRKKLYEGQLPDEVVGALEAGRKFIPLRKEVEINPDNLPAEYVLQDVTLDGDVYRAIIPRRVRMHIGDKENPDELWDVYQEILQFEKVLMKERRTDIRSSFFGQEVRDSYEVAMINNLLVGEGKTGDAEFKPEILKRYEGRDEVNRTIQDIAKTYSGLQQLDKVKPQEVLKHVTEEMEITVKKKVLCDRGSHFEWSEVAERVSVKVTKEKLEAIGDLENQVLSSVYTEEAKDEKEKIRRKNELRSYINMRYLAKTGTIIPLVTTEEEEKGATPVTAEQEEVKKKAKPRKSSRRSR